MTRTYRPEISATQSRALLMNRFVVVWLAVIGFACLLASEGERGAAIADGQPTPKGSSYAYDFAVSPATSLAQVWSGASRSDAPAATPGPRAAPWPSAPATSRRSAAKARPPVNWDGQAKHFLGHNSYTQARSQLTADPAS